MSTNNNQSLRMFSLSLNNYCPHFHAVTLHKIQSGVKPIKILIEMLSCTSNSYLCMSLNYVDPH